MFHTPTENFKIFHSWHGIVWYARGISTNLPKRVHDLTETKPQSFGVFSRWFLIKTWFPAYSYTEAERMKEHGAVFLDLDGSGIGCQTEVPY